MSPTADLSPRPYSDPSSRPFLLGFDKQKNVGGACGEYVTSMFIVALMFSDGECLLGSASILAVDAVKSSHRRWSHLRTSRYVRPAQSPCFVSCFRTAGAGFAGC